MKLKTNCNSIALYFKHITEEIFDESFIKSHAHDVFEINVETSADCVCVNASFLQLHSSQTEFISSHPSASTARSCAVGRCVISIANALGCHAPVYGVLTGVRPLKIASDLVAKYGEKNISNRLYETYLVQPSKSELLQSCLKYDTLVRGETSKNDISIYISIPFCPSRCNYCSFVSSSIESKRGLIPQYIELLACEIKEISKVISEFNLNVKSIYVGGGTPGILETEQLDFLLNIISAHLFTNTTKEFTYELGRPDTASLEKLRLLKLYNVDRVCINTQTTNNEILKKIGRKHTAEQYFTAIEDALKIGFNSINTDIIAGLTDENLSSFKNTVDSVISTGVDNVTVHTLCIKKSSDIKRANSRPTSINEISDFLEYSKKTCISKGYEPYYLYRQKYALGNHESVGYCKNEKYSLYNISMMNEVQTVIGLGAGATSRVLACGDGVKHSHFENYKYPQDYIRDTAKSFKQIEEIKKALKQNL